MSLKVINDKTIFSLSKKTCIYVRCQYFILIRIFISRDIIVHRVVLSIITQLFLSLLRFKVSDENNENVNGLEES